MKIFTNTKKNILGGLKFDLKMKLSLLFFLTVLLSMQANESYSQGTKITLKMDHVTVEDVLDEIESKTEFKFLLK